MSDWSSDHYTKLRISGSNWNRTYTYNFYKNTWYHIVVCDDGTHTYGYVNGILIGDTAASFLPTSIEGTDICIGGATYYSGMQFFGKINDVRIYDHCLSAAEVREISQGLILHYKLDGGLFGNSNLLLNTHFDNRYNQTTGWDTTKNGTLLANDWGGYNSGVANQATCYHAHLTLFNNEYVYEYTKESESWLGISQGGLQNKLVAGKKYTFSCEQYSVTNTNYMLGGLYYYKTGASSAGFHLGYIYCNTNRQSNTWQKFTYTFTAPSDGDYAKAMRWYCYGHSGGAGTFYLRHLKLEEGEAATQWCLADSESNINHNIIEDSSGYNYNGTIIGTPYLTSNSAHYEHATYFINRPCAIKSVSTFSHLNTFTYSCWFKRNTSEEAFILMGYQYGNNSSGSLAIVGNKPGFHYYVHANGQGDTQVGITQTCNDNNWHHLAATYDGTTIITYYDGIQTAEKNITLLTTTRTFSLNYTNTSSSNRDYQGQLSDARVYCTVLDANAIRQLYEVGVKIDNKQNLHTFELNEINSNIFAGKMWSNSYGSHTPLTSPFINYNLNGEPQFTTNGTSAGSEYIKITPGTYEYDYTISVNTGNRFYIGIERYDANKTSRSNAACVYTTAIKPTADIVKQRYKGTVNLTTDGTNTIDTITLRILNGWSGTTSGVTGLATIHSFSLKLQSSGIDPSLKRTGQFTAGEFKEETNTKFYKDHIVEANEIIEL